MRAPVETQEHARALRRTLSAPEVRLWMRLRRREPGTPVFRRQHPIGPYVLDFYCAKAKLAVEVDGTAHGFGDRPARDARKDAYLRSLGLHVHRVAAASVLKDPDEIAFGLAALARDLTQRRI